MIIRLLLLWSIRLYWIFPYKPRRCCIFKETCSAHVYRITKDYGVKKGLNALYRRFKQCRGGYSFVMIDDKEFVLLKDHSLVDLHEMNV